jgi:hypothetical protein
MGVRKPSKNYNLSGEEKLTGPPDPGMVVWPVTMDKAQKAVIHKFCKYLTEHWPSQSLNSDLADQRYCAFVDPTGFWFSLFNVEFRKFIGFLEARPEGNRSERVSCSKFGRNVCLNVRFLGYWMCQGDVQIGKFCLLEYRHVLIGLSAR